ncbi:MAG: cytidine deaminase [Bacilli bacterium]|nr:cytidine deaminase [Bacilli bacterium]
MERIDKINYYLDLAEVALERSTCLRRNWGAVIVKNDEIIATGYNGAPRGRENCIDLNYCMREKMNIPRGERYEMCRSVHAEANAIISASRTDLIDSTIYMVGKEAASGTYVKNANSCAMCKRMIINAGIKTIIIRDTKNEYRTINVEEFITNDETLTETTGY